MHNSKYQCHMATCCTYHQPTYFSLLLNRSHIKNLKKHIEGFSGKSSGKWTSRQNKDKTEKVTGLGRRTREERAKWNQMTALRFQTRGKHQTSPASLWGPTTQQNTTQYNISHRYVCSCTAIAVLDAYQNNKIPSPNKALRKITQKRQNSSAVDSSALWDGSRERDKLMS